MKINIKTKILLLVLLIAGGAAKAQDTEFASLGAEWYYEYQMFWTEGFVKIASEADTVINGSRFKKLVKSRHVYNYVEDVSSDYVIGYEFVLQQGDSVMILRNGHVYKLFDFGAKIGDSWEIPQTYRTDADSVGAVVVVGKGEEKVFGLNLRYIDINDMPESSCGYGCHGYTPCRVYEKIGPINSYLFPEQLYNPDFHEGGVLRCYHEDAVIMRFSNVDCDYMPLSLTEQENNKSVTVFPNPARNNVNITLPTFEGISVLKVFDALGRQFDVIKLVKETYSLDTSHYPTGFYSLIVQSDSKTYCGFFIKL